MINNSNNNSNNRPSNAIHSLQDGSSSSSTPFQKPTNTPFHKRSADEPSENLPDQKKRKLLRENSLEQLVGFFNKKKSPLPQGLSNHKKQNQKPNCNTNSTITSSGSLNDLNFVFQPPTPIKNLINLFSSHNEKIDNNNILSESNVATQLPPLPPTPTPTPTSPPTPWGSQEMVGHNGSFLPKFLTLSKDMISLVHNNYGNNQQSPNSNKPTGGLTLSPTTAAKSQPIDTQSTEDFGKYTEILKSLQVQVNLSGHMINYSNLKDLILTEPEFDLFFNHSDIPIDPQFFSIKRNHIVHEILQTETYYVKMLQLCMMVYLSPMEEALKSSSSTQMDKHKSGILNFFSTLKNIINVNGILLSLLRQRVTTWSQCPKLGDVMFFITPYLKVYCPYSTSYQEVFNSIEHLRKNDLKLSDIINNGCAHPLIKKLSITSLLITPVQRVPRYVLLLTDLLKNTEKGDPDFELLEKSLESMKEIAHEINQSISQGEARMKCVQIQNLIMDSKWGSKNLPLETLVEASRQLKGEGILHLSNNGEKKPRRLFLFNDILLCTTQVNSEKLNVNKTLYLEAIEVHDIPETLSFRICTSNNMHDTYFTDNYKDKQSWLKILFETIASRKAEIADLNNRKLGRI